MLGGSISKKVKIVEPQLVGLPSEVDQVLQQSIYMTPTPRLSEFSHGLVSMVPTNQLGFDQYEGAYHARDEQKLHDALHKGVSGRGARYDNPRFARAVFESLKSAPAIAHAYLTGRVKTVR